ncbi:OB-fold domain-containing protein [Nocardia tengchongensis]|uniref:OB-fold domain-containing protein n=1 Tax=Nocardia tengchongensis TaxID=2055889 RepID=A0ABX8CKV0_9NOCA|nr:OB-fold domain-containing protein [Nocardia tengchongensis]QVI19493.1 OB-fold domain-containing protein [Nocardia tengchongensis]
MFDHKPENPRHLNAPSGRHGGATLMIRRCTNCATLVAPMTKTCSSCRATTLDWVPSTGTGSIVSWKVAHHPSNIGTWEQSTVAIVELDDGPWIYSTIDGELPPPSDQPIRVRYEPDPPEDQFPVFTIDTTDPRPPHATTPPANAPNNPQPVTSPATHTTHDPGWVRSSMTYCDFLAANKSLDTDARSVVEFAIQRAPSGGASAGELLVAFGVTRWRFVQMVREALAQRPGDTRDARTLKRNLLDSLSWAWRPTPTPWPPTSPASTTLMHVSLCCKEIRQQARRQTGCPAEQPVPTLAVKVEMRASPRRLTTRVYFR